MQIAYVCVLSPYVVYVCIIYPYVYSGKHETDGIYSVLGHSVIMNAELNGGAVGSHYNVFCIFFSAAPQLFLIHFQTFYLYCQLLLGYLSVY